MRKKEIILALLLVLLIPIMGYFLFYYNKIAPRIYVAGMNVGGKSKGEAVEIVKSKIAPPDTIKITIDTPERENFAIPLSDLSFSYDVDKTIDSAYQIAKSGNVASDIAKSIALFGEPINLNLMYVLDENKLEMYLSTIAGQTSVEAIYPKVSLVNNGIVVQEGKKGFDLDTQNIKRQIHNQLSRGKGDEIIIRLVEVDPTLSEQEVAEAKLRAEKLVDKSLVLKLEFDTTTVSKQNLLDLLSLKSNYKAVEQYVDTVAKKHNREAVNPVFVFLPAQAGEGGRVKEFTPAKSGIEVKNDELVKQIIDGVEKLASTDTKVVEINIPVSLTEPKITTSEVNSLGIKELIGRGTSKYVGSIPSRVYNVNLGASRINGVLVAPGETFSFNNAIGDISKLTGYKEAYVISNGKTVLGDGGGVCQVSSTLFRAVMNAGLPITERRAHSYRVGYYEQESSVGFDATVYSPTTDFKFKNDTPAHVLIQTISDPKNYSLIFEIYGTSDGRISSVSKPMVTDVTPPTEDLYVDDPTLPTGQIKQVEHKAYGAKSTFNYEVKRGGETIYQKTFVSTYRPWQAVYLRGTGPTQ